MQARVKQGYEGCVYEGCVRVKQGYEGCVYEGCVYECCIYGHVKQGDGDGRE